MTNKHTYRPQLVKEDLNLLITVKVASRIGTSLVYPNYVAISLNLGISLGPIFGKMLNNSYFVVTRDLISVFKEGGETRLEALAATLDGLSGTSFRGRSTSALFGDVLVTFVIIGRRWLWFLFDRPHW